MKREEKLGLNSILEEIKNGLSLNEISKKYTIPKQTISYNVEKLKKLGCLEKEGHGVSTIWKVLKLVPNRPKDTSEPKTGLKEIRGHAFIWNIEFVDGGYNWDQIVTNYKKKYPKSRLSFKMICGGKVPRVIFKGRKIWLTKSGLTIYEPLDFLGKSSFTVKGTAIFEMDRLIKDLLKRLNLNMQFYRFKCSREHFAHVKNQMARQFNDEKKKIYVEFDGKHFWIDHSHGENEEETDDVNISRQAQKYYKDAVSEKFSQKHSVIRKNFEETTNQIKEVTKLVKKNSENAEYYGENMVSHVAVMKSINKKLKKMDEREERFLSIMESLANK